MASAEIVLSLNSGSSSLKLGAFARNGDREEVVWTGAALGIGRGSGTLRLEAADGTVLLEREHVSETQDQALDQLATALQPHMGVPPVAVAHRIVHGGPLLREHQVVTPEVLHQLEDAEPLAPLHIPSALAMLRKATRLYPRVPQIACFDTSFHRTLPPVAAHLPIPESLFAKGIQRYGFHGLSCQSVMRRLGTPAPAKLVIAHLGSGSSLTAVRDGQSIDTTMGLSPSGGIPMSTRTGDLDPAVLLYLLRQNRASYQDLEQFVNREGGLAGLSGGEGDMQTLLQRADQGDAAAALAVEAFCTAIRKTLGSYAALMGGVDLLVFTGGIGEHSAPVRERVLHGLDFLFPQSKPAVRILPAQEELEMAYQARPHSQAAPSRS